MEYQERYSQWLADPSIDEETNAAGNALQRQTSKP